ncbi:hypothetical protein MTR62_13760 [Novosphingobium sp. 1949]|uniref:DUF3618 domain-containing protein n=1 Tax=Novosphingobium organovorum TaxID=2930092 RepID=A0ABT0BFC5_9SPHN|nr:hypothetical protein [Novosphingobium organovorum]MCJ2183748.1 hypothetical protein [Novosphingobium organovorum]
MTGKSQDRTLLALHGAPARSATDSSAKVDSADTATSLSARELLGPSPNPATNLAMADIALRTGSLLARRAVERALLGKAYSPRKANRILRGRTITEIMLHRTIARIAMRSVPGAILVGGSLVAKTLYDRRRARQARSEGQARLEKMARDGEND